MTAKTGAKFAVGVVSLIAVGMIGFQIANHSHAPLSPDSSMVQSTTQPTNQMSRTASTQPASGQAGHQKVNVARGDSINAVLVPKAPVKENPTEDAFPPMEAHKESATITEESHNQSTRLQTGRSETVFEKYLRIKNSPEFQRDWTAEVDGIFEKYVSSIHEREALEQEQQRLQETLVEASEENRAEIVSLYGMREPNENYKDFDNDDFGFRKITIERPLYDEKGNPIIDNKGNKKANASLRDTEIVLLKEDIHEYFMREVLPHVPDAWIDESKTKIGYEIPFTRYFYKFTPLRNSSEIMAEIKALEERISSNLLEVLGK